MKLFELTEETELGHKTLQGIAKEIEISCGDFAEMYRMSDGASFLYRGVKNAPSVFKKAIRQDRAPVEMDVIAHNELHQAFLDYGLTVTRTNSLFTTGKLSIAKDWGEPYVVFVYDGWTGLAFDRYGKDDYSFYSLRDRAQNNNIKDVLDNLQPNEFNDMDNMLYYAENQFHEILIKGTNYIGVKLSQLRPLCKLLDIPYDL